VLKDILHTVGTRYFVAFLNLILIFVNAKVLGLKGVGMIGIIWASVNIVVMLNSVLSGSTIVYFVNRFPIYLIYPISIIWIFLGSVLGCLAMQLLGLLPDGYFWDIYLITVLYSMAIANSRFLLAKDQITGFNLVSIIQGGLLFFILLYFYFVAGKKEVSSYVWGLYITNILAFIVSLVLLLPFLLKKESGKIENTISIFSLLKKMFSYGLWGSADNIAEVCTSRLNYFFVERFVGLGSVGLLDVGTKVSESVWNISRSVAYIEYNRVAKETETEIQKLITLQLFKFIFCAMVLVMGCVLLIPEWVYTEYLFSHEFIGVRKVIIALSVGIIMAGCNSILSHYFIGSGKIKYSTISSCLGLVTLVLLGLLLIPIYGVIGSAVSTSIAFTVMLLFSLITFIKQTKSTYKDFLPTKEDVKALKKFLKRSNSTIQPN